MSLTAVPLHLLDPAFEVAELREAEDKFNEEWLPLHHLEEEIFHYTSAQGLIGVVKNRKVWASHISTLNDPDEWVHGTALVREIIDSLCACEPHPGRKEFLEELLRTFQWPMHEWFIVSFCAEGNLLSNWRAYADQGCGYRLGFTFSELTHIKPDPSDDASRWRKPYLRKVIYDPALQRALIEKWLKAAATAAGETGAGRHNHMHGVMACQAVNLLWELVACFKKSQYECEKEWRLVWTTLDTHDLTNMQFRQSGSLLVPYRVLILADLKADAEPAQFPLTSISFGPCLEPNVAISSVKTLLRNAGQFTDNMITPSAVRIIGPGFRLR